MRYDDYNFSDVMPPPDCKAHTEGYRAFMDGRMLNENPYILGTISNSQWALGWLDCSAEEGEDHV